MDFYNTIKNLDEEQIRELISFKIDQLRYLSRVFPNRFIGVDCNINPELTLDGEVEQKSQAVWQGFIPEDVKIVYSYVKNEDGYTVNNGCYYYMDDFDYIYEFAKFIKAKAPENEMGFLTFLQNFIDQYFRGITIKEQKRDDMHRPLVDKEGRYIAPTIGHHFSDFKGINNARCSEYSAMAQNILSIFDYKMMYLDGAVNTPDAKGGHSFNFTIVDGIPCIIDFTMAVATISLNGEFVTYTPFIGYINDYSPENLRQHILEREPFDFLDYYNLLAKENIFTVVTGHKRNYIVGNVEYYDKTLRKKY